MPQVATTELPPPSAAAPGAAPDELSAALQHAFPPLDAPANLLPDETPPVAAALRAVVPPPIPVSSEELAEDLRYQRLLFKRGPASISVEALLAIGFSLGFHTILMGLFWLGLFLAVRAAGKGPAGWAPEADSGGSGGYMIMGTGPQGDPNLGGDVQDLLAKAGRAAPPTPALPPLEKHDTLKDLIQSELASAPSELALIGVSRGTADLGTLKVRPPAPPAPPAPPTPPLPTINVFNIAPPAPAGARIPDPDPTALASAAGKTGPKPGARTPGPGLGGTDDDEPVIDIMKPGAGGTGKGSGKHAGDGLDRGSSGANNESPQVLDAPPLDVPTALRLKPPHHAAVFEVTVLTDGRPGKIELTESCGQKEIDALCQATVAKYRFRPAYLAGHAIAKAMTVSFSFGEN